MSAQSIYPPETHDSRRALRQPEASGAGRESSNMAAMTEAQRLGDVVLAFSLEGRFPIDIVDLPAASETDPGPTIEALEKAKTELEMTIRTINEETRDDVGSWVKNAKILQEDIIRSKVVANDIVRQSEAPDASGQAIQDAEARAELLVHEAQYNEQLRDVLLRIQHIDQLLGEVDQASREWRILDSLRLLERSWAALDQLGVSKNTRILRLLDSRAFELKSAVHNVLSQAWKALVQVDMEAGTVTIAVECQDKNISLTDVVVGFKAYKEVEERMEQFWRNLDAAVVSPRMNSQRSPIPAIRVEDGIIALSGVSGASVETLLSDLEGLLLFISKKLPQDLLQPFSGFMMADVILKLIKDWLNPAIPSGLRDMDVFEALMSKTKAFCETLDGAGYSGLQELQQWADKAPLRWLEKCRETALDTIRTSLAGGMGESKRVEKIERQMVSLAEGKELAATGAGAAAGSNDWGSAWGDAWDDDNNQHNGDQALEEQLNGEEKTAEDDGGADAWGWDEDADADADEAPPAETTKAEEQPKDVTEDADDGADAWGWGDEVADPEPEPDPEPERAAKASSEKRKQAQSSTAMPSAKRRASKAAEVETRELVFKEAYSISSMPEPVLELIFSILEDGATLTKDGHEQNLVAATAPGLFGLPTFALALFRAISPHYYSLGGPGGNMFLYNDATYLAEKLSDFSSSWKQRGDLSPRAQNMLRLENDVKSLESFANRSYSNEMNMQKTVLQDLIGSSQNVIHQDEKEAAVESGTARIRTMAATWEPILRRSAWSQAIGSLADSLASRIISDVLELPSIGQEEAYSIAKLITSVTELDSLFLPSRLSGTTATATATVSKMEDEAEVPTEVPTTAQYAPNWLRLKYLSEVLQSNLNEVKFLWCESELSLYFTVEEVVDLIQASFEDNPRTRETIREIKAKHTR